MFCVMAMAVFAHDATGSTSDGFAISLGAFQLVLTYMWWRTGIHDPGHRPASIPYTVANVIVTTLFFVSVFVESPVNLYLWAIATLITMLLPLMVFVVGRNNLEFQKHLEVATHPSHSLVERFGLFTIIVIGEVVVSVVRGVAEYDQLTWDVGVVVVLGMLTAFAMWWLFFDTVSHRLPRENQVWTTLWMYTHLPVNAGIAMIGAANLNVVEHAGEALPQQVRWLLVMSITVVILGIALLIRAVQPHEDFEGAYRNAQRCMIGIAPFLLLFGFTDLWTAPFLVCIVTLLLIPIVAGLISWTQIAETLSEDATR
jgi:low temperature requirement protein LtrA